MPLWTVRLEADESELPVLLSNGQLVEQGKLPQGRHFVVWKVRSARLNDAFFHSIRDGGWKGAGGAQHHRTPQYL